MCVPLPSLALFPLFPNLNPSSCCLLLFHLDDPYYIQEKLAYEKSDLLREHGVDEVPEVELTEAQKIALMGRPRLGDQCRCTIRIKESKEFKSLCGWMKPSDGHSRRICKILKSEWWRQVRTFKDLLRIACANRMDGHPGSRQYRQWCNVADSTSEFLWRTVRPTLPVQKKGNPVQGHVLNLSTTPIPEEHERVLGLGPKYCFEPHLNPFEKIATARAVSRCAKEDERSRKLHVLVADKEGYFAVMNYEEYSQKSEAAINKNFKGVRNTVDKLFQRANVSLMIGTSSWKEQFIEAITVVADDDEEGGEDGDEVTVRMPSCSDYVMHVFTVFWKVLFAFVPPTDYWGGWACFVTSILLIGVLTAFVGDLASHFGCTIGLKDSVTAISLVALGTSIPDTFASKVAAQNDKYADSSIGNVTGSNAVNVFLGIGVAWSLAALVHWGRGTTFEVLPGNLAFSVTIFCVCALLCCVVLLMRRNKIVGGELGGPMRFKLPTTILFGGLWVFYVTMSALEAYGVVQGF
ncbi:hypothetical protein HPB50_007132 [Hyalomma asiaticum]|uniref:Uncharacterized protein n=1 Tax=Hyalomma asiaticum TaxID=266040 RepID=A0ACB7RSA4_HYAAI|nr:hypothetical protein HPB50_007132 [Hyalomma asiaticum]